MTPRINLYALLGVTKSASKETIRQAYYGLAKKLHPDIIKLTSTSKEAEKKAEDEFKEITYAYDVLSDEDARTKYDRESDESGTQTTEPGHVDPNAPFTFYRNPIHAHAAAQAIQFAYFAEVRRKQREEGRYSTKSERPTSYFESEHLTYDQFPLPEAYHEEILQYRIKQELVKRKMIQNGIGSVALWLVVLICLYFSPLTERIRTRALEQQILSTLGPHEGDDTHLPRLQRRP